MKTAVACIMMLWVATAWAETVVVEYPTYFYVESAVEVRETTETAPASEPVETPASAAALRKAQRAKAKPVTNLSPVPADPEERRTALREEIGRLQRERDELLATQVDPTSEAASQIQRDASLRLRKINKLESELLKLPGR